MNWIAILLLAIFNQDPDLNKLIEALGNEHAAVRAAAHQDLLSLGTKVLPRLRKELNNSDEEVKSRISEIVNELETQIKLLPYLKPHASVTLKVTDCPLDSVLSAITQQTGITFNIVPRVNPVTFEVTRAPLMETLDKLADLIEMQWRFESDGQVYWMGGPRRNTPSQYVNGFKVSIGRLDVYRSWNYQEGHGLFWLYLNAKVEPGVRPIGPPKFYLKELKDGTGLDLKWDVEMQEATPVGAGFDFDSSPFTVNALPKGAKKLSVISGKAVFTFPLKRSEFSIDVAAHDVDGKYGSLSLQTAEALNTGLILHVRSSGDLQYLIQHIDRSTMVLTDVDGNAYTYGDDFDARMDYMSQDSLRYKIEFTEGITFQPVSLTMTITDQFYEKVVPFEFKDVEIP